MHVDLTKDLLHVTALAAPSGLLVKHCFCAELCLHSSNKLQLSSSLLVSVREGSCVERELSVRDHLTVVPKVQLIRAKVCEKRVNSHSISCPPPPNPPFSAWMNQ